MPTFGETGDAAAGVPPEGGSIGKYVLVRLIGRGGMGLVHEAMHPELRKRVAIKTLLPEMAAVPGALQRFLQEGEAASRIKHPNVVNVLDVGTHQGLPFLVMEYLEGESLAERFVRVPAGPVDEIIDLLLPAIAAVAAGHEEGVIHRDLKPPNIFLERGRRGELTPKVLDFGISKLVGTPAHLSLTGNAGILGTLSYMAPEQAENARTVDGRADQYAFGLILYEGLTGQRAFDDKLGIKVLVDIINGRIDPPRLLRFEIPAGLEAVILRALRVNPQDRFPTLRALGAALLPFASSKQRLMWEESFAEKGTTASPMARTMPLGEFPPTPAAPFGPGWQPPATTLQHSARAATAKDDRDDRDDDGDDDLTSLRPRRSWLAWVVAAGVVLAGGIFAGNRLSPKLRSSSVPIPVAVEIPRPGPVQRPDPAPPTTYVARTRVVPANALIELDDEPAGRGTFQRELVADGRAHRLHLTLDNYQPQTLTFDDGHPLPSQIVLSPKLAPVAPPAAAVRRSPRRSQGRAEPEDVVPARRAAPAPSLVPKRTINNAPILH